jgi:hypothetical protein
MRSTRSRTTAPGPRAPRNSRSAGTRSLSALLALFALLLVAVPASSQLRPKLVAYLQVSVKSRALESALAKQMPSVDVVVCSRYRDFEREIAQAPDAVLTLQPVLQAHGLAVDLRGTRAGSDSEPYVLLSIGGTHDKSRFAKLSIGAVDLLGRERTAEFVASLLGLKTAPPIKYVIKSEDLLPLLQFNSAEAVLLSEPEAMRIKSLSKLDLRITPLPTRVGLAAVSFRTDVGRRLIRRSVETLDLETRRRLGVEAWQ